MLDVLKDLLGIAEVEGIVGDRTTLARAHAVIAKAKGGSEEGRRLLEPEWGYDERGCVEKPIKIAKSPVPGVATSFKWQTRK